MLRASLAPEGRVLSVLALGAHPDDIEIGCGGSLLTLAAAHPGLEAHLIVLTGTAERAGEFRAAASAFLPDGHVRVGQHHLPDGYLPAHWAEVKGILEEAAGQLQPDVIFAPHGGDAHQDHRLVAETVGSVWRNHLVLGYEIPKYDGDLGQPQVYMPLTRDVALAKVALLHEHYETQLQRDWFDDEVFLGLARLRGMECRSAYAEAFVTTKLVLAP